MAAAGDVDGPAAAVVMLIVLGVSYLGGGYVAGRLARFRGARAGFGVWAIAGPLTILMAGLGALIGVQLDLLAQVELPRFSLGAGSVALSGLVTLVVSSALTLASAPLRRAPRGALSPADRRGARYGLTSRIWQ